MDKEFRSQFMHSNGTSPIDTVTVIIPSFFYTVFTTTLTSLIATNTSFKARFLGEFATLVVPTVLTLTVLHNYNLEIIVAIFIVTVSLLVFKRHVKGQKSTTQVRGDFVTNARSTINLLSVIAILAVDFRIFPRQYAKTENFGYSLMDVGVGLYIYANGIVHSSQTMAKSLKSIIPLLLMGLVRFFSVWLFDYNVPVTEYGLHWNFFITLAVIKIFTSLFLNVVKVEFIYINALLLLLSHEILLQMGLKNFVLAELKRSTFLVANREGIVSSVGYLSLYLLSVYFGHFFRLKTAKKVKLAWKLMIFSLISLGLSLVLTYYFNISRKLANSAYCFWVLFIGGFMTSLFYFAEIIQESMFGLSSFFSPLLFQAINYNGLIFFLLSNLLTGIINVLCNSLNVDWIFALIIITIYMFINCSLVCYLYCRKIKVKL